MQLPSYESLRCFEAAANAPSFRAAAKLVALTPAALGQRIRQLEDQLGIRLFERSTRSLHLTDGGRALLPHVRSALAAARAVLTAAAAEQAPQVETVMVGTIHSLGQGFTSELLKALRVDHPNVVTHLYFGSCPDLFQRVRNRELDCAITSSPRSDPLLEYIPLQRRDFVFVGAPRLLRALPLRTEEDAARHLLLDSHREQPFVQYLRGKSVEGPEVAFRGVRWLGAAETIRRQVLAGEGVAVLPLHVVQPDIEAGRLTVLLPELDVRPGQFRFIFRRDDPRRGLFESLGGTIAGIPLVVEGRVEEADTPSPDEEATSPGTLRA
jgi:DNA-binding transcriptional LysR family regulator